MHVKASQDRDSEPFKNLTLTLHADEVQAGNSSATKIFPIFVSLNELNPSVRKKHFFIVGLFVGKNKPSVESFLGPICEELRELETKPVTWKKFNQEFVESTFHLIGIVADAPLRAFLRGVRQHNHFHGCDWCVIKASTSDRARMYPNLNLQRISELSRNHQDFLSFQLIPESNVEIDNNRFNGLLNCSPLLQLESFDIVKGVAFEPMHCIVFGIFRNLFLKGWLTDGKALDVDRNLFQKELSGRLAKF